LVTSTDSEVLCRLVRRWIGQGDKASLTNTSDVDILEFIIGKLWARILANARPFLVKIKTHRDEPLNEKTDDLADEGKALVTRCSEKGGGRVLNGRATAERSGQVTYRVVQTSTRALGRRADRTGRFDREVGDSSIGVMDTEDGMEQNGDKNDVGTVVHYPRKHYVDNRFLDTGR
jgi:hypothetical protein